MKKIDLQKIPLANYVVFSIAVLLIYAIIVLVMSAFGIQSDTLTTLTTCIFSTFGGECLFCCLIKLLKIHKEAKIGKGTDGMI